MEVGLNNAMLNNQVMPGVDPIMNIYEENDSEANQKKELEELIKNVPYSLCVALIKISQLHGYEPMDIDTLYQKILPAFPLLRRNDGSKYQSHSINTVRSAMVSNKLYSKNPQGKYVINIPNAIKIVKTIKNKKNLKAEEQEMKQRAYNSSKAKAYDSSTNDSVMNYDSQNFDTSNFPNVSSKPKKPRIKKPKEFKDYNMIAINPNSKYKIEKYEKSFNNLRNVLKNSMNDNALYSQLNIDFDSLTDPANLQNNKLNIDKVIGMLTVFKFFKPFLEKSLNSMDRQENILTKLIDLTDDVHYMESLYKYDDE